MIGFLQCHHYRKQGVSFKKMLLLLLTWYNFNPALASKWPLRGKYRNDVPNSFDCAVRKAAYSYGKKLIPRRGKFLELYYALDLNSDDCKAVYDEQSNGTDLITTTRQAPFFDKTNNESFTKFARRNTRALKYKSGQNDKRFPYSTVFVAVSGDDKHPEAGKKDSPFQSIQAAVDYAATISSPSGKTKKSKPMVVLRGGTYHVSKTIQLNAMHNEMHIVSYPGETPIISGGIELKISSWKPYSRKMRNPKNKMRTPTSETVGNILEDNIWVADISDQIRKGDDVPGLHINGKRATRARYPNLPGGIEVSCGYGCMIDGQSAQWTPPQFSKYGNVTYYTDNLTSHRRRNGGWFEQYMIGTNGLCSVYDPPVSYWCSEDPSGGGAFAFRTPSGVTVNLPNAPYESANDAIFFVWRPQRWANWMFEVEHYDPATGNFTFGKGGNQGARGENSGGDFFIENVLEELDYPNEFYHDKESGKLYLFYNGTGPPPVESSFVVPKLRTLFNITGTQWNPVKNVQISGVKFQASRYTYMDPHGVPSAGDWALERTAAFFIQGTEKISVTNCIFDRLDGNAMMISGYNRNATIFNSDFSFIGGSAITSWGYTNETRTDPGRPGIILENAPIAGVDGTDGEHPRHTHISGCTAREVGLYEKQSSFYMQAKTAHTTITHNVFFNGPRAGINMNDGFGGGDEISHNLVFSTCRESGDHGPFNSWDRQPFLTMVTGEDGKMQPSMQMQWRRIHHNFFIDNYSPQENVDNDDGSAYFKTHNNFLVYGSRGMKNDYGGHDNHHFRNIYAYSDKVIGICDQLEGHEDRFYSNRVIITGDNVGDFQCSGPGKLIIHNNEYYTASGNIMECNMPLTDWQKKGEDKNSTVKKHPSDQTIIEWAKKLLDF